MKLIITTLFLISSLTIFSQSNQIIGDYIRTLGDEEAHIIKYKLTLNQDGTFFFHSYSNNKKGIPPEVNKYGKGTWKADKNIISFFTDKKNDIDEKHNLDFENSKARFISKSPRDKTDKIIKTSLRFFESKIFWIEKLQIFKE
ncbi:hypothetical protein CJ739_2499 [Mariniflexile rhizosphaerae]|uniref:copper resistance protein NlpE N-terminal domain-containing protein n=1 Tax=unclassified Mariniflexile TaxID=2643887 RepID=UPI000E334FA1|nr:copper resistance protein NlpE N-terminal domain-containing protein [Mariniflexile sp. TRM1-10]AXP81572.1 hypothetical protein CJ739_2499 [Mariniflexile sp. TRM1-10]